MSKFICLEGIEYKNKFFTIYDESHDQTKLNNGTTAFKILGYADTPEEALRILFPNRKDEYKTIYNYFANQVNKIEKINV